MQTILKNELAIIQGPPGTGKTFVGSQIVQMLLKAKKKCKLFRGPIFVVCFTNHALDQFLEHVMEYTQKIVRMGGQSRNEDLKQ
jgi:superfamily II DNA or RNA helicase